MSKTLTTLLVLSLIAAPGAALADHAAKMAKIDRL